MRLATVCATASLILCAPAVAQDAPPFDPQVRVTEALAAIRPIAYHRATLDWTSIEARARGLATDAKDDVDLLPAYLALVWYLDDNHSTMRSPDNLNHAWTARYGDRRLVPDLPARARPNSSFIGRETPSAEMRQIAGGGSAALIVVPAKDEEESTESAYAQNLYAAVAELQPGACGYILDLRGNTGGDMWPMVTGLADLIGDGSRLGFVDPDGVMSQFATLRNGAAAFVDETGQEHLISRVTAWRSVPEAASAPVALLLDEATASSGEATALAFIGKPSVRSFGATTAGLASANEERVMSSGVRLFITTGMTPDRNGRTYPRGIAPDEPISQGAGRSDDPDDAVVEAAKAWLATQPACAS